MYGSTDWFVRLYQQQRCVGFADVFGVCCPGDVSGPDAGQLGRVGAGSVGADSLDGRGEGFGHGEQPRRHHRFVCVCGRVCVRVRDLTNVLVWAVRCVCVGGGALASCRTASSLCQVCVSMANRLSAFLLLRHCHSAPCSILLECQINSTQNPVLLWDSHTNEVFDTC